MNADDRDPMVNRAIDELRRLPPLDRDAVQRVVRAAAAARVSPADAPDPADLPRTRSIRVWSAIGLAAAAAVAGFIVGGTRLTQRTPEAAPAAAVAPMAGFTAQPVARNTSDAAAIPQQFVLNDRTARSVSVVGDFNNWNPKTHVMVRGEDGVWSVILPIVPGRHVYGFMVNDSVFTLDPRKPTSRDPDLGSEGSVLMVGRP